MTASFDRCEHAILGHAIADNFQSKTRMAYTLGQCLQKHKKFDASHVMKDYLSAYKICQFNVDGITEIVFDQLKKAESESPHKSNNDKFYFESAKIESVVKSVHDAQHGISGGCNPAQRSFYLACCPWIDDSELFHTAYNESRLTNFSPIAGQVAGLVNLICRGLIKGDSWDDAVKTAFSSISNLLGEIQQILATYKDGSTLNHHNLFVYAPNTLNAALYFVEKADSFEKALQNAQQSDACDCSILVGILAGARWGVPTSMLNRIDKQLMTQIKQLANLFAHEWRKQATRDKAPPYSIGILPHLFSPLK